MKTLTALMAALIAITMTCQSQAAQVVSTSPDQGQTRAFASIESRGLHWNARDQMLTAVITYSNKNYEAPMVNPHDDTMAFSLPGVRYDQANNLFYAMSKDGLLPWFGKLHPKYRTPHIATITTAAFVGTCAGTMPMSLVGELTSIGTLLAFVLVCIGIPILRIKNPDAHRPFKTPAYWFVAPAGAIACLWVMSGLPKDTWIRLLVWLLIGFAIYFGYGSRHSKLRNPS